MYAHMQMRVCRRPPKGELGPIPTQEETETQTRERGRRREIGESKLLANRYVCSGRVCSRQVIAGQLRSGQVLADRYAAGTRGRCIRTTVVDVDDDEGENNQFPDCLHHAYAYDIAMGDIRCLAMTMMIMKRGSDACVRARVLCRAYGGCVTQAVCGLVVNLFLH